MFFFYVLLVTVICHHVLSLNLIPQNITAKPLNKNLSIVNKRTFSAFNTNYETSGCPPQQVFNIYNSECNEQTTNKPSVEIPKDYTVTSGIGAHKLHLETKNWNDARKTCIKEGGYLAIINSEKEEILFLWLTSLNKLSQCWLGVHDLFKDGDWVTVSGVPLDNVGYKHWSDGEPNNADGDEHCAGYADKGMNDMKCSNEYSFICEADLN